MKTQSRTAALIAALKADKAIFTGAVLAVISALFFAIEAAVTPRNTASNFSIFMVHLLLCIAFAVVWIVVSARKRSANHSRPHKFMLLSLLLFINSFSLNRSIVIFEESCWWLQIALIVSWVALFATILFDVLPRWLRLFVGMLLGMSVVLFLYFVMKLGIFHLIGLFGLVFIGFGLHVFVPAILVFMLIRFIVLHAKTTRWLLLSFFVGVALALGATTYVVVQFASIDTQVQRAYNRQLLDDKSGLPAWVEVSKHLERNSITEMYMKAGIIYPFHEFWTSNDWFGLRERNFDDIRQHNPLVIVASQFVDCRTVPYDDKIRILSSLYDKQHQAQERLWSGNNLSTRNVLTNVRLYPEVRLAYTEKTVTIVNNFETSPDFAQWYRDEAIYTFQLPEGSCVTSLSLWINGKEQKAALTSKFRADSAYRTIVGAEQRDPSLVRWQEGNTVSVRVFPCTPGDNRVFKIGITSPLQCADNTLSYQNITFDGPKVDASQETIKMELVGNPVDVSFDGITPEHESPAVYLSEDSYRSQWSITMSKPALLDKPFTFENESYRIDSLRYQTEKLNLKTVYLDVNAQWTKADYELIAQNIGSATLVINNNGLWPVTATQGYEVFEKAQRNQFSFFPFFEIKDPEHALIISKGNRNSPQLIDLAGSEYGERMKHYFAESRNLHLAVIDGQQASYVKMLKELRVVKTSNLNHSRLAALLHNQQFTYPYEDTNCVALEESQTSIRRLPTEGKSSAPEHLLRMFVYNNVLRMIGTNYFTERFATRPICNEAVKGFVVSPVTSLIVLETADDYKRFGITTNDKHSLGNASAKAEGAAPEPFEWMLIVLCVLVLAWVLWRKKRFAR